MGGEGYVRGFAWLGVLRHGESTGNVAANLAESGGAEAVDIDLPDPLVGLTERGRAQSAAAAGWLYQRDAGDRPDVVVSSPYRRAVETAEMVAARLGLSVPEDERLRDRELGILDRLTRLGVAQRFPDEYARRAYLGPFYYRPPGGESWADVALRLRSALTDLGERYAGRRVLLVAHEAVIFLCRYLVEELSVSELAELSRQRLANAGLTNWTAVDGVLRLTAFDDTAPALDRATRQDHV